MSSGYRWKVAEGLWVGPLPVAYVSALVASGKVPGQTVLQDSEGREVGLIIDQPELQEALLSWAASQAPEITPRSPIKLVPAAQPPRVGAAGSAAPTQAPVKLQTKDVVEAPSSAPTKNRNSPAVQAGYVEDWSVLEAPEITSERPESEHSFHGQWVDEDGIGDMELPQTDLPALKRLGFQLVQRGDFLEAVGVLDQYLVQSPKHPEILSARAFCRFHLAREHHDRVAQLEVAHGLMTANATSLWMLLFAVRMNIVLQRTRLAQDLLIVAEGTPCDDMDALQQLPKVRQMVEARRSELNRTKARVRR